MCPAPCIRLEEQFESVVKELVTHFGLANAKSVLSDGAGGLSALLNAEWLRDEMLLHGIDHVAELRR